MSIFFFILGAIIASFIGVVASRRASGQSIFSGRSRCDACNRELGVLDLLPILSYAFTIGRCRSCKVRISLIPTLAEVALGILFVASYDALGLSLPLLVLLIALAYLLVIVLYDLMHGIIPPGFLWPFAFSAALFAGLSDADLVSAITTAGLIGFSLLALYVLSRGKAIGLADAPLAAALALLVGPAALAGFIFSFWIGAAVGVIVLAGRPRGHRMGIEVPFAPFLAGGFLLAYFSGWDPFTLIANLVLSGASP